MKLTVLLIIVLLLPTPVIAIDGCEPEPASQWAPAGFVCPPVFGEGIASTWQGPGVATNSCVYPWTDCTPIRITVLATGAWIEVRPTQWCMCWVGVTGPNGETQRLVDLDPDTVTALGLGGPGLFAVRVDPAGGVEPPLGPSGDAVGPLPDTAVSR